MGDDYDEGEEEEEEDDEMPEELQDELSEISIERGDNLLKQDRIP